jgi:hypothetical protein
LARELGTSPYAVTAVNFRQEEAIVPSIGVNSHDQEPGVYRLLYQTAKGPGKRTGDQDQDARKSGHQNVDHCLDFTEEGRSI